MKKKCVELIIGYVSNFNDKLADFLYNRFNFFENITKEEYKYNDKLFQKE